MSQLSFRKLHGIIKLFPNITAVGMPIPITNWAVSAMAHKLRVEKLLQGNLYKDPNHPIYNFIFNYFFFKPSTLFQYSAGLDAILALDESFQKFLNPKGLSKNSDGIFYDPNLHFRTQNQKESITFTLSLLQSVYGRAPSFCCFGLHEWAMLYRVNESGNMPSKCSPRQALPLRLSQDDIKKIVESNNIRCSHIDAFRFFTPLARYLFLDV